ncbi:hypothetical protein ACHQM5_001364 [Ranunculus cassubicifolius]
MDAHVVVDDNNEELDTLCALCDNGGELLCCEGRCGRYFHATAEHGFDSQCSSLGFSMTQVEAMTTFECLNCVHKKHQCFACQKLGSSDESSAAEVFQCSTPTCSYFYHPECVAKLLHPMDKAEANVAEKKISAGESFTCPAHECYVCKQGENENDPELKFAVCRLCPKSYHRKCMPRQIIFSDTKNGAGEEDILTRAWPNLLPHNRVLIYCSRHKIKGTAFE